MKNMKLFMVMPIVFSGWISASVSAEVFCSGKIDAVGLSRWDVVFIHSKELFGDTDGRKLCVIDTLYQSVETHTCELWYSKLLSAQMSGTTVTLEYGGEAKENDCDAHEPWSGYIVPYTINLGAF